MVSSMKVALAILAVLAVLLGAGWLVRHNKAVAQQKMDQERIMQFSNEWAKASDNLAEQKKVNISLETNLMQRFEEITALSNQVISVAGALAKTEAEKKAALEEITKRDTHISELESQRDDLTKKMTDLNGSIASLETQIGETERKLTAAEGDRAWLLKELKRLQEEKAALEKQFNDLALLREQVRKLRDELSIQRRIEWLRRGLYGTAPKGAELLQKGVAASKPQTNYNLEVELNRDGTVKITPGTTNSPPPPEAPK
jgi:chromosome segregation ATPase